MSGGRRTSLATLAGAKIDAVPGQSDPLLLTIPLEKLVPTRFNPRRNFGTDEELLAFGLVLKHRQLQPAVVVSRTAYLKLWPDEEEHVGVTPYVIANGERRYRGSLAAGLTSLAVVHNENVASTRADFLDAVLSENNDREDLDPIERAIGIETMVEQLGGADKVAQHYQKSEGWVSQQRKLLKLTPELQALVSAGEMPQRVGRTIAGLPPGQQREAWAVEVERRAEKAVAPSLRGRAAAKTTPEKPKELVVAQPSLPSPAEPPEVEGHTEVVLQGPSEPTIFTAVKNDSTQAPLGEQSPAASEKEPTDVGAPAASAPTATSEDEWIETTPWEQPTLLGLVALERMRVEDRRQLVKVLLNGQA